MWKSGLKNCALQSLRFALTKALMAPEDKNFVDQLRAKLAVDWTAIREARRRAEQAREKVSKSLTEMNFVSGDTSVVVFGSLARDEFTDESDLDWTLLVDGQADSDHLHTAQAIRKKLTLAGFKEPGRTGMFGNTTFQSRPNSPHRRRGRYKSKYDPENSPSSRIAGYQQR
jgi:predicted nucleotidyltransferase